jgi:ferredoxin-NADP reductase
VSPFCVPWPGQFNGYNTVVVTEILGALLVGLVACQLGLYLFSSFRRLVHEQQARRLDLELLRQRVEAAAFQRQQKEEERHVWEGFRKFVVRRKVAESPDVCSFYLAPHDGMPLPPFRPGQFLTFRLKVPGQAKPVVRCYSLSDCSRPDYYRVTIKKMPPPPDKASCRPGLASCFFHDEVKEGDILDVQAPRGNFELDLSRTAPVVLIAGGVGLTPLLCMVNALAARGAARETWLFYGARNRRDQIMAEHLRQLAMQLPWFHLRVCYSNPTADDVKGTDYDCGQRISLELLRAQLPSNNYEFYVCGPPGMMTAICQSLKEWGVPASKVFSEAFGPAAAPKAPPPASTPGAAAPVACKVAFVRSGKTVPWDSQAGNLLTLARSNGVDIPSGCCVGNCGTCETAVRSGEVRYATEPAWKAQPGTCLVCVAAPKGDLELDA